MAPDLTREEMLEKLLDAYSGYFDIERAESSALPLVAVCHFNVRTAKYVLLKKAELWSADSNEHVYIFSVPELNEELYRSCEKLAYDRGMALIDPKPGHMYTYITAVFLCDTCTPEAEKLLKRCRLYKSFHFSWYGWMNVHTAAVICKESRVMTNRMGRGNAKFMKNILSSCKEKKEGENT